MESKKRGNILSVVLYNIIFILLSIFAVNVAYAYFTATASKGGDVSFASLSLNILNESDGNLSNDSFTSYLDQDLLPGDTITFDNIKVENASNVSSYALVNLNIDVIPTDTTKAALTYNKWYNLSGQEVDTNFVNTDATLMASNEDKTLDINFTFPGEDITNAYKNAKTRVTLGAYGTQENLRDSQAYVSKTKYASYHIIKNANRIQEQIPGKNLFNIDKFLTGVDSTAVNNIYKGQYGHLFVKTMGYMENANGYDFALKQKTQYTFSGKYKWVSSSSASTIFRLVIMYSNGTSESIQITNSMINSQLNTAEQTFSVTTKANQTVSLIKCGAWAHTGLIEFYDIQLEEGTEQTEYEPYIIDFAYGKNLFDFETALTRQPYGTTEKVSNGYKSTVSTLSSSNRIQILTPMTNFKAGQQYTVSFTSDFTPSSVYIGESNSLEDTSTYGKYVTSSKSNPITFTISTITKTYLHLYVYYANAPIGTEFSVTNIQIEKGSTATSYWPYGDLVDPLRKVGVGKNLFSGWKVGEIDVKTGNETGGTGIISDFIEIDPTETYTMSLQTSPSYNVVVAPRFYNANKEYIGYNAWQINTGKKSLTLDSSKFVPSTNYTTNIPTDTTPAYVRLRVIASNQFVTQEDYKTNLLQLEKGSTATAYEAYTGVEDTYDETTKTITRNVGIFEMKSSLTYSTKTNTDPNYTSFWISQYSNMTDCETNSIKTIFYCTHFPYRYSNITYVNRTDEGIMGYGDSSAAFMLTVESSLASTLEEFQGYLAEQETLGDPVFLYYPKMSGTTQVVG